MARLIVFEIQLLLKGGLGGKNSRIPYRGWEVKTPTVESGFEGRFWSCLEVISTTSRTTSRKSPRYFLAITISKSIS